MRLPVTNSLFWSVLAGCLLATVLPAQQEGPPPAKLNLVIIEGEGAINNIRQRVSREAIVQVEDENRKPVAGATVVFLLPNEGASGVFTDGSRMLTVTTDQNGRAAMRGFQPNNQAGQFQIRVTASFRGVTASTVINQSNILGAAAAGGAAVSGKLIAVIVAVGAAAGVGAAVALSGNGGQSRPGPGPAPTPVPSPTTITPGAPTVGAPPR